jgi:hypothetical protein
MSKMFSLTLLTGRESLRSAPVVPLIPDQRYYGGDTGGAPGYERGSDDGPEGKRLALANR